jgi:predicted nucleic acid-binding protein
VILADTSVWIDHLRRGNAALAASLDRGDVATHPFVIGELACGRMRARHQILAMLRGLPSVATMSHDEATHFLEAHRLSGQGLGWIDIHLLGAAILADIPLVTLDARLAAAHARVAAR